MKIHWFVSEPFVRCDDVADELEKLVEAHLMLDDANILTWDIDRLVQELRERDAV